MLKNTKSSHAFHLSSIVIFCFFLSGAAGLIYQVLWLRMIDKVVGSAPFAVATVLSVFMGGLALGSYIAGRYIDRVGSRHSLLFIYGIAEAAIGIYGLLLPFLIFAVKPVYVIAYNLLFEHFWFYLLFTFFGCSMLLLIPTTLMGITLPVLCRFYVANLGHLGARTGRLYGINTIGAAGGAILCGFLLIARFGVWGSLFTAAGINFFVGILCIVLARRHASVESEGGIKTWEESKPMDQGYPEASHRGYDRTVSWALWIFGISGFCSMAYEVFWARLLGLIIGPTTYSFTIVVSTFIVGLALGSLLFGWLADRVRGVFWMLAITQVCAACLALLISQFLGNSQFFFSKLIYTFQDDFGEIVMLKAVILFFILIGPTIFLGATFPLVNKLYARSIPVLGKSIGTAYAVNTIGAILGSFVAGFIFIPLLGKENGLRVVTGLQFAVALFALTWLVIRSGEKKGVNIRSLATVLGSLVLGVALLINFPSWDRGGLARGWYHRFEELGPYFNTTSWLEAAWKGSAKLGQYKKGDSEVVFYGDGIGGFTTVVRFIDSIGTTIYSLLNSGKADASTHPQDISTMTIAAHFPLLFHPDPEKVMVIGLASGMTAGEALLYPGVKKMDVLEINDQVLEACEFFNPWNNNCLTDPRSRIIIQDGRNHLELTREKYDVIISEPSNPWMAGLANLFTLDFFETIKERMTDKGVFIQWIHSYQTDWSSFAMVGRTFGEVFPEGILVKATSADFLLIGFKGQKSMDLDVAYRNLPSARKSKNITIRDPKPLFRMIVTEDLKGFFGPGPLHTDNMPRLEFAAPKNLAKRDLSIAERITKGGRLSGQTMELVESGKDIDSSLDLLELSMVNMSSFDIIDFDKASPSQLKRYEDTLCRYCDNVFVDNYEKIPRPDLKLKCAQLQADKILDHIAAGYGDGNAYFNLAASYKVLGKTREEIDALKKAISLDPTLYDAYKSLGVVLVNQGRIEEAGTYLSEALRIMPDNAEAFNNLGNVLAAQGKITDAIDSFSKAIEIMPGYVEALNNLGNVLAAQGKTADAVNYYFKALQIKPDHAETLNNLGNVYATQGKIANAIEYYSKAIGIMPDYVDAHYNLARIYATQGRFDDSMIHFYELVKINPENADVHSDMGLVLMSQGKINEAEEHFSKAIGLDPNHFSANYNMGVTLANKGHLEEAADHLFKAVKTHPDNPAVHKLLGVVLGSLGRIEEAAQHFAEALKFNADDDAELHDNLGVALAKMGRLKKAVIHFSRALEIDSSFDIARNHLESVQREMAKVSATP